MIPSRRFVILVALGTLPALLAVLDPLLAYAAATWDVALALLLGVDLLLRPWTAALEVDRRVDEILSIGQEATVRLRLCWRGARPLALALRDDPPASAGAALISRTLTLPPRSQVDLPYPFTPLRRGEHTFGDLHLRLRGPLGLSWFLVRVPLKTRVKVYPDLGALARDLRVVVRRAELGARRRRPRRREGRDFDALRDYVPGDDIRHVEWKATARRGAPVTRLFRPDQHQSILLLLDCGRAMRPVVGDRRKLDYAVDAALALGHVALSQRDRVGLLVFHHEVTAFLPPASDRAQRLRLAEALFGVEPTLTESSYAAAIDTLRRRIHRRSLVVIFSDLPDEVSAEPLLERLGLLRGRHLPLLVTFEDTTLTHLASLRPQSEADAYRRLAAARLARERLRVRRHLAARGAHVVEAQAPALTARAVEHYLHVKSRGLL